MDTETALIRSLTHADWLTDLAVNLHFPGSYLSWNDRMAEAIDLLMECAGLEAYEGDTGRTIIAFPHRTRRKRPAFIAIHSGRNYEFDEAFARITGATFTIEFVEAGKYGVAGESAADTAGTEAEDTALQH
ncbi:hypothetical protein ParaKuw1_00033 [Paracoccus phage ParKuw1]|uniref:Uncharacterized protein n=1 Tax=Paracoccus phage ParKuw1 TaxID=3032415 RepID=A0AAF0FJA3_9CAUD|nr:hypothetical protein ParaKuw1_00033 [Paracoccus phage ParKuw1]